MIDLPTKPGPVDLTWRHIDFGGQLTPALGGEVQRINRLGNRFALSVTLPPMEPTTAAEWAAKLNRGVLEGVRWKLRQVGLAPSAPGDPLVNGGNQVGSMIAVRGATPNFAFRPGRFATIRSASGGRLHMIGDQAIATGGSLAVAIVPPLRSSPADGDRFDVATPSIEGLLEGDALSWTIDRARRVGLAFAIVEQR